MKYLSKIILTLMLAMFVPSVAMAYDYDRKFAVKFNAQAKRLYGPNTDMSLDGRCDRNGCYWWWYREHEVREERGVFSVFTVNKGKEKREESRKFLTVILSLVYTKDLNVAKQAADRLSRNCINGILQHKSMVINYVSNDGASCRVMIFEEDD